MTTATNTASLAMVAVLFLACRQVQAGAYSDAVLADNPVSYWQFDDPSANSGDMAADTMGISPGTYQVSSGLTIDLVPNPIPWHRTRQAASRRTFLANRQSGADRRFAGGHFRFQE